MCGPPVLTRQLSAAVNTAARYLREAEAILVTAGAGMGVDSGLPDFRGVEGLWRCYPPLRDRRLGFAEAASPHWFQSDPNFAWGFYGHRLNLYRRTIPHPGFARLLDLGRRCKHGIWVFTSNVDGQFQRAGFPADRVCECHGSIHWLQTLDGDRVWPADGVQLPEVDAAKLWIPTGSLPRCPMSDALARPNILMFGDWHWNSSRTDLQHDGLMAWLDKVPVTRLVVVELGAGNAVPTVRRFSEQQAACGAALVRINTRDPEIPSMMPEAVGVPLGGAEALERIASVVE